MFNFILSLLQSIFSTIFKKRKDIIFTLLLLKKEYEIYKRHLNLQNKRVFTNRNDRLSLSLIASLSKKVISHLSIVKPKTLLYWQRRFIKKYWTYKHKPPGRKPVSREIKDLILEMKQENHLWGSMKISDELKKIGIEIHPTTVNKIIQTFRKNGQIQPVGSWKKFLKAHWNSLFSMDYMTIDTLIGKRLYLLLILELKSRRIVKWSLTQYPCREFVKQRIIDFSEEYPDSYLIHDNDSQFISIDYSQYNIIAINSCFLPRISVRILNCHYALEEKHIQI
jgi:putative transposase